MGESVCYNREAFTCNYMYYTKLKVNYNKMKRKESVKESTW